MKQLFEDLFIYENILISYYSNERQTFNALFNDNLELIIQRFLEIFMNEDEQKGTNHVQLIYQIYANHKFQNREEYFKDLHISNSTFQRYRQKYCLTLKLVLERFAKDKKIS